MKRRRLAAGCLLFAHGCAVGPDYSRPAAPVAPAYAETPPGWKRGTPADERPRGPWWWMFQDPVLDALETRIEINNQTLKAAYAQLMQARAVVRFARAGYFPTLGVGASATRNRVSERRSIPGTVTNFSDFTLTGDIGYEFDLWGRIRRSVEAARADAQASAADLESVRLSLHAELAIDYLLLRTYEAELALLRSTVVAFQQALTLTVNRHAGGLASGADVAQAQTQLEITRAQAVDIEIAGATQRHAIAVLVGQPPSTLAIPASGRPLVTPIVPPGLPSELLERRPDIAAAERRMAAANARIGVARAAYYPTVSLIASGGVESTSLTNLFSLPSTLFSVGASAAQTLFDGGRRGALEDEARAAYDETVANYRQTVLVAFREVEDNLAALRILAEEAQLQEAAVGSAERSLTLSTNRYTGGIVTYLEVITAQSTALSTERTAIDILRRRLLASVQLVKALGGGWIAPREFRR